ncbi:hypothetical protein CRUP_035965 [Coryphaenoides rupestris]|nr:hypothetical protein CRUP_035965 [Coryphaenoides rupestris]
MQVVGSVYSSVFTEIGCIPMTITSHTKEGGWTTLSTFNWVLGNTDPMDYVPPSICAQAQLEPLAATEKADSFFTVLKSLSKQTKVEN